MIEQKGAPGVFLGHKPLGSSDYCHSRTEKATCKLIVAIMKLEGRGELH